MSQMLLTCKTTEAVLLCAVADAQGVLRFPCADLRGDVARQNLNPLPPGLVLGVRPGLAINIQLVEVAASYFAADVARRLVIEREFADVLTATGAPHVGERPERGASAVTLYVANLPPAAGIVASPDWATMPDLLRRLEGKARVPYMRAWQVLAGGLQLATKAVEAKDVLKYFDS